MLFKTKWLGILSVALVLGCLLYLIAKRPKHSKRSTDRKMGRADKRLYRQAMALKHQDPQGSSQILESIGRHRDAILVLEEAGLVIESGQMLIRMGHPDRAAKLYEKAQLWQPAASSYEKAQRYAQAGHCWRQHGDYKRALKLFLKAQDIASQALCYLDLGQYHEAARCFIEAGLVAKASALYGAVLEQAGDLSTLTFEAAEQKALADFILSGQALEPGVAFALARYEHVTQCLAGLLHQNRLTEALEIYNLGAQDLGDKLLSYNDFSATFSQALGQLFQKAYHFLYAGMSYERINDHEQAGQAYAKAEQYQRALDAFERSGNQAMAHEMRLQLAQHGPRPSHQESEESNTPFVIGTATNTPPQLPSSNTEDHQDTVVAQTQVKIVLEEDFPPQQQQNIANPGLNLTSSEWTILVRSGTIKTYDKQDILLESNTQPDGLYIVVSGSLAVTEPDGPHYWPPKLYPTHIFGIYWLEFELYWPAQLQAVEKTQVLWIPAGNWQEKWHHDRALGQKVVKQWLLQITEFYTSIRNHKDYEDPPKIPKPA